MTATTKTVLAIVLTVGVALAGMVGTVFLSAPPEGNAEAAGDNSEFSSVRGSKKHLEIPDANAEDENADARAEVDADSDASEPKSKGRSITAEKSKTRYSQQTRYSQDEKDVKGVGSKRLKTEVSADLPAEDEDSDTSETKFKGRSFATDRTKSKSSSEKWDLKATNPKRQKIEAALSKDTDANFTQSKLSESLATIETSNGIQIVIDRGALDDEKISTDEEVTLTMSGISLKGLLRLILEPKQLDYLVKDEYLLITTKAVANRTLETRAYQSNRLRNIDPDDLSHIIRTVVAPGRWNSPGPIKAFAAKRTRGTGAGAAVKGNPLADLGAADGGTTTSRNKAADDSTKTEKTDHSSGGSSGVVATEPDLGSIHTTSSTLVIRATQRIHEEIAELLDQLEQQQAPLRSYEYRARPHTVDSEYR